LYEVVVGVVSIINAVIITGTYQTVSKYVSEDESKADSVKSKALKVQAVVGGCASAGFFLLAPVVANYLNDPRLTDYLRLASLITLAYSFYAVFTGYFNGQRRFLTQAGLDAAYSTLKVVFIVSLVWLGYGVAGGIGGFALAAASILVMSVLVAGKGTGRGHVAAGDLLRFQSYLLAFTLVLNLLQKTDLILVKALSSLDPVVASRNAGYYGAAINIANLTYQFIISATFILFPLVSRSTFTNDLRGASSYISTTVRYVLMAMALIATLFSANSTEVIALIYLDQYQAASGALSVVAYGMLLFGLLYVLTTVISASGRPGLSLAVGCAALLASAAGNMILIPRYGLVGAAISTTAAMGLGVAIAGSYVLFTFKALIEPLSALRITAAAVVVYCLSVWFEAGSKPVVLVKLAVLSVVYVIGLIATREIGRRDVAVIRRVVGRPDHESRTGADQSANLSRQSGG
jgi:stage V sporulation protein B